MLRTVGFAACVFAVLFTGSASLAATVTVAEARQSLVGHWKGKLEYRDYRSDAWFGLPVVVNIADGGDGVTQIRTADYDDGPKVGNVRITTVMMLGPGGDEESAATFRKGRAVELSKAKLAVAAASLSPTDWTMIETSQGEDADRPATLRLTTTRKDGKVVVLKEIDFSDDDKTEWLIRNRTTLEAQ
jgi:hypothetical protein